MSGPVCLVLFVWYGKDRTDQFSDYFACVDLPAVLIDPLFYFAGLWEIIVAIPFVAALAHLSRWKTTQAWDRAVGPGFVLSASTPIAFSGFDVIAGDRADLREHALYLALLLVSYIVTGRMRPEHLRGVAP